MTNRRRAAALLLCLGLVFALAVSSLFIVHEAGHHCTGDDCPICRMIASCGNLLRAAGIAVMILTALFPALEEKYAHRERQRLCLPACGTLVSWKIRLDD